MGEGIGGTVLETHGSQKTERTDRRTLYPAIEPYRQGMLDVGDGHRIYFEESGRPDGLPVLFLHGGPGGGTAPAQRRFFDPARYRIILFDQRGCGRSKPHAGLEANTTMHLIRDIERLREHLCVTRWLLFGGSWGSTLALLYAEAHPEQVLGLILRGIFLMTQRELDWFYKDGTNAIFPEAFEEFIGYLPKAERDDPIAAYYRRLTGADRTTMLEAARIWSRWETRTVTLVPDPVQILREERDDFALAFARIEAHYFQHKGFLREDGQILADCHRIRHLPVVIVQGRYDAICPPRSAFALKAALPEADLRIAAIAGHSAFEPEIVHELVTTMDRFAEERAGR